MRQYLRDDQLLLAHMHSGIGMENANLLEAVLCGADGIWAGFTREAATIGHTPTAEFLANLARIGNDEVARSYPLDRLVPIAHEMTEINTGWATPDDFPIIGSNAYRTMLSFFEQDTGKKMDLPAERIGATPGWRIAPTVSDNRVIRGRLHETHPEISVTDDELLTEMRSLMRRDMCAGKRIEYDEPHALLDLYQRASAATQSAATPSESGTPSDDDRVLDLPGFGKVAQTQFAGYASIAPGTNGEEGTDGLFYWFVGAPEHTSSPTVLWSNGGPGASSFWGFFLENGPYNVDPDGTVTDYARGWHHTFNYMIFEHPLGVGLSFAADDALPTDVRTGIDQLYRGLQDFLDKHPEIRANPIILAGESYGGTYMPLLAKAILDGNATGHDTIELGGVVVAAPWVAPALQQATDSTWAYTHGLITAQQKAILDKMCKECLDAIAAQTPSSRDAERICAKLKDTIGDISGRYLLNLAQLDDPDNQWVTAYLNRPDVRLAIHAKPPSDTTEFGFSTPRIYAGTRSAWRTRTQAPSPSCSRRASRSWSCPAWRTVPT